MLNILKKKNQNNIKKLVILAFFSVIFSQPEIGVSGYLREVEMSFCIDECGEYYIETFGDMYWPIIFNDDILNINLYTDRYVEVLIGEEVACTECNAYQIQEISLSDDCISPILCIADPCEVAHECQINTPTECLANYCGGCYADFYDLNHNLVDCNSILDECEDLSDIDFGACLMVLGIGYVNGECNYVSGCGWQVDGVDYSESFYSNIDDCNEQCNNEVNCENIEENFLLLHSGLYTECEYDIDCMSVWGHCDIGLGECHYAVNTINYPENQINEQVDLWFNNECISGICDCVDFPYAYCHDGTCELLYCYEPSPVGCFQTGCPEGFECIDDWENNCVSSLCWCDENYTEWFCTEDCNGGTCYPIQILGDLNNDSEINVLDIISIVSFILMTDSPSDIEFYVGDINSDELLNILDIIAIIQIILNPAELPDDCYIEPEIGRCDGLCLTYYYNQDSNECEEFMTGCCGIEAFSTLGECQNVCE